MSRIVNEEDPKIVARNERRTPEVEKLLRNVMKLDGPKGVSNAYRDNYDRIFGKKGKEEECSDTSDTDSAESPDDSKNSSPPESAPSVENK